jgi:hypothetical protein
MTAIGVFATSSAAVQQFEDWIGKGVDFVSANTGRASWSDWQSSIDWTASWTKSLNIPVHWTIPMFANGGNLTAAATGDYDAHYLQAAKDILAASAGQDKIVIRVGAEFNGSWFPWAAKGHEQDFVQAYRNFVDAFRSVSDKFVFEWNVAVGAPGMDPAAAYPGDKYVDIIGGDFYYSTKYMTSNSDQAWNQIVNQKYGLQWLSDFATAHGKPMGFSEWGVDSNNAQSYIVDAATWFATHNVAYQSYWNSNSGGFTGQLSNNQYPTTGAAFVAAFGATASDPAALPGGATSTKSYAGGVLTGDVIKYAAGGSDVSDTKEYTAGVLTRETLLHSDGSKDVFIYGITGQNYVAEHDIYNAAGTLTGVIQIHADQSLAFTSSTAADGTRTTDQYDSAGVLTNHAVSYIDGSTDNTTYINGVPDQEVVKFAAGSADLSDTRIFTAGVLTLDTVLHANGSKDVYVYGIQNQNYVSEHDVYNSAGVLTTTIQTLINGATDTKSYSGSVLTGEVVNYAAGGTDASDTMVFTAGVMSRETVLHTDGSKDVYNYGIKNQSYVTEHDIYDAAGKLTDVIRSHADNSLAYTFNIAADGSTIRDLYDTSGTLTSHGVVHPDGSSDAELYTNGILASDVLKFAPGSADQSDTKLYTGGVLTRDTILHANGSKDVYDTNIAGKDYVAEHDIYSAAGVLLTAIQTLNSGATDTKSYAGKTLTSGVVQYAAGGTDVSDTKIYKAGVLTSETVQHVSGSKDVYLSGILNKSYVAEHDAYDAAGKLTASIRTHADKSLDATSSFAVDGTRTVDQYDASGVLKIDSVLHTDGSSDTKNYTGGNLTSDIVKFAPGSPDLSDTKNFTNGVLTRDTIVHADASKDVFDFNVSGKSYVADHFTYNSAGKLSVADLTNTDGTHTITASATGATMTSTPGVTDTFQAWSGGKDNFVFNANFGKDTFNGFHAGNGSSHDVITLDTNMVADYSHLQFQQIGHDTLVIVDSMDTILLTGISHSALTASNFSFVHHDLIV